MSPCWGNKEVLTGEMRRRWHFWSTLIIPVLSFVSVVYYKVLLWKYIDRLFRCVALLGNKQVIRGGKRQRCHFWSPLYNSDDFSALGSKLTPENSHRPVTEARQTSHFLPPLQSCLFCPSDDVPNTDSRGNIILVLSLSRTRSCSSFAVRLITYLPPYTCPRHTPGPTLLIR